MKFFLLIIFLQSTNLISFADQEIYQSQMAICNKIQDPKLASECRNNVLLLMAKQIVAQQADKQSKEQTNQVPNNSANNNQNNNDDDTSEILNCFSNALTNFGNIMIAPNNPVNVGYGICGILAEMVKILSTMTRQIKIPKNDECSE